MKTMIVLALALGGALAVKNLWCGDCCGLSGLSDEPGVADAAPAGQYVEARTASVYAGACHYNGELTTAGKSAVLAWRLESGVYHGVTLAGVEVVAAVTADDNLKSDAARRSVLFVDSQAQAPQREAAERWLRETHGDVLGDVLEVRAVPVDVESDGESYRVRAGDSVELAGAAMPDRECCKMPFNVWYEPFERVEKPLVANSSLFAWDVERLAPRFERADHNDAFVGRFGGEVAALESACTSTPSRASALLDTASKDSCCSKPKSATQP